MSLKVLIALAVVMVCALAMSNAEPVKAGDGMKAEMVKGVDELDTFREINSRVVRSPGKISCADKACVKGCRMVNGKPECLP